jgi:nitrite reductase (NADH) large subunit
MTRTKLLVIGNGMASLRFLEDVVALAPDRFAITVAGDEPEPAYNRVLLSPLLAGEIGAGDVAMKPRSWYVANGIRLLTSVKVIAVDPRARRATLCDGRTLEFDTCVIATGSSPIRLPVAGGDLAGVEVFRSLSDIGRLSAVDGGDAGTIVIGGGLLGIEAAYGLQRTGARVTLVHLMDRLMERQIDATGASVLKSALEKKGITVCLRAETERIDGDGSVAALVLRDGQKIPASRVVLAVGIRPNTGLATDAGITCRRGVVVDNQMQTSVPHIYAIGECAEHRGVVYGLVEPAYEQARVAARSICGVAAAYEGTVLATNLKVSGVPVFSAGDFEGAGAEQILWHDAVCGSYRKFVIREGRLIGVVLIGDTTDALWYRDLIRNGDAISAIRSTLAFGRGYAEAA